MTTNNQTDSSSEPGSTSNDSTTSNPSTSTSTNTTTTTTTSSKNEPISSTAYLLTDPANVPDLATVTPLEALSYLNQSLENLIMVYQSTVSFLDMENEKNGRNRNSPHGQDNREKSESADVENQETQRNQDTNNNDTNNSSLCENQDQNEEADYLTHLNNFSSKKDPSPSLNNHNRSISCCSLMETFKSVSHLYPSPNGSSNGYGSALSSRPQQQPPPLAEQYLSLRSNNRTINNNHVGNNSNNNSTQDNSHDNNSNNENNCHESNDNVDKSSNDAANCQNSTTDNTSNNTGNNTSNTDTTTNPVRKPATDPALIFQEAAVVAAVLVKGTEEKQQKLLLQQQLLQQSQQLQDSLTDNVTTPPPLSPLPPSNPDGEADNNNDASKGLKDDPNYNSNDIDPTTLLQKSALLRRFFSKSAPPFTLWSYLLRLHHFSPMSTSVYLASSFYIYKLCIHQRSITLTPKSAHRLVLASLRVASKVVEDLIYPPNRYAITCGVSAAEVQRLEIGVMYLVDFDVCVSQDKLQEHLTKLAELEVQARRHGKYMERKRKRQEAAGKV